MFPLRDDTPRHGPAPVTWVLIAVNLAVLLYTLGFESERQLGLFFLRYGFVPREFFAAPLAEASTLLTSMFVHGGVAHIVGNMFFLFVFGDNVEERLGSARFLWFYLVGGAVATLAHGVFSLASPVPMVGASGAVSAVLGAYMLMFPRQRVLTFIPPLLLPWLVLSLLMRVPRFFLLWLPAWLYIGYWALIQFLEATEGGLLAAGGVDDVAWWAHLGGFAYGVLAVRGRLGGRPPLG